MVSYGVIKTNFFSLLHSHDTSNRLSCSTTNLPLHHQKFFAVSALQQDSERDKRNVIVKMEGTSDNHMERPSDNLVEETSENQMKTLNFSGEKPSTPVLDTINHPMHMKNLSIEELKALADELREDIVYTVSKTGGHLSSSLGVTELTVALHHVFDSPNDKIIWDVGHQAYPHKILTGRRSKMHTIRQNYGLAGFPKREESEHDAFGVGHSSTSISAGLGMAVGRDLLGKKNHVISVIGDGAMTAGQAFEGLNNAGFVDSNLIIILNDNKQVSLPTATADGPAPPVGALSQALSKLQADRGLIQICSITTATITENGSHSHELAARLDFCLKETNGKSTGSCLFEDLRMYYIGPVDGHNVEHLVTILKTIKETPYAGPIMIHIITEKGKGYPPAEAAADKMHGVVKFDPKTGQQLKSKPITLSYTQYFAESLIAEAEKDDKIVAIHAAMGGGTGLNIFHKHFPDRCFDVGIAEQHAVTFAAGFAAEGLKPFCAIYSSFLQRGYDQVVHDVDLQKLPVRFIMDRAGLVGADGPTHCGAFDTAYMACLPNMVVMAPSDEAELMHMIATAATINDKPSCLRYPRGNGIGAILPPHNKGTPIEIGKGRILREGNRVAILGFGTIVQNCLAAAKLLEEHGISVTVADARFCKPLDGDLITKLAKEHEVLITVEEASIGGFSSHVAQFLSLNGLLDSNLKWRGMFLPDRYIDHGDQSYQIEQAGLSPKHIAANVMSLIGEGKDVFQLVGV